MKKLILISFFIIIVLCIFGYIYLNQKPISECQRLAKLLDKGPGRSEIENGEVIGGTLVEVSEPYYHVDTDKEQNKTSYRLTFKGINSEYKLTLRTYSYLPFAYDLNTFYAFNLSNIRTSGMLGGSYFDFDMTNLKPVSCKN